MVLWRWRCDPLEELKSSSAAVVSSSEAHAAVSPAGRSLKLLMRCTLEEEGLSMEAIRQRFMWRFRRMLTFFTAVLRRLSKDQLLLLMSIGECLKLINQVKGMCSNVKYESVGSLTYIYSVLRRKKGCWIRSCCAIGSLVNDAYWNGITIEFILDDND